MPVDASSFTGECLRDQRALPHCAGQQDRLTAIDSVLRIPVAAIVLDKPQIMAAIGEIKDCRMRGCPRSEMNSQGSLSVRLVRYRLITHSSSWSPRCVVAGAHG
jgi:hypothetical protein